MFNKLKFNNLVISNKKGIQQSRIQTINKLVHKIRKLKSLAEKHPDNTKCKERIRKSTETMEILKKVKRAEIMKKLLLMEKPAAAIITNGTSVPEEIAVALLSMNKVMQNLIKRFKTELKISELETDDWKKVLLESSKRERKIDRTEQKRRKRMQTKQLKVMGKKRQEWLAENQTKIEPESLPSAADANLLATGGISENPVSGNEEEDTVDNPIKKLKININERPLLKSTMVPNEKLEIAKKEEIDSPEDNSIEDGRYTKQLNNVKQNFEMCKTNSNDDEEETENSLVVDPFFITDTGENYLSTAVSNKDVNSDEDDHENRDLHMIKLNKFGRPNLESKESPYQRRQQHGNKWESRDQQNKPHIDKNNRNSKSSRNQFTRQNNVQRSQQNYNKKDVTNSSNEKILHPSWAAKQKLKPVITDFKGKKITFNDDLSNTGNTHPEDDLKHKKPVLIKSNDVQKDALHPSWAAKQKLKPSITTFQGKKITFDNDE